MPLSPEQISKMDEALGGKSKTSPDIISEMDAVVSGGNARAGSALEAAGLGVSGGQLPFGNVITSGLAAAATTPFTGYDGEPVMDRYKRLYDEAQAYTKATQEAHPAATTVGNIAGIASTLPAAFSSPVQGAGLIATPAKGLQGASNFATKMASAAPFAGKGILSKTGNLATRMVGGAAVAAPVGGLYAAGEADAGNRMEAMGEGARTGAVIGAALPVAGAVIGGLGGAAIKGTKNIIAGIGARGEDVIGDALGAIEDGSRALYSAADNAGVLAKPEAVQPLLDNLSGVVKNKDIASQKLYSSTLGAIKDLGDDIAAGNTGLMTLDRHRQILGNLAKDITNPNKAQEAEAAGRAIGFIDDFIENLTPDKLLSGDVSAANALTAARAEWSKSKRFEKIGQIIVNASNDANKLKRDLEKFRTNPKNTLGWSESELEALKQASTQTTGEGVLKLLGKFGFDLGGSRPVGNTALPIISGLASGIGASSTGIGALVPIVGTAARSAQKALASGKAEQLLKVIEQGGKVTNKMVAELPKSEQNKFLSKVMQMPVAKATRIFTTKDKVK